MAFNLTRYIFPIQSKIEISSTFGLLLDNPRTNEEISFIENFIKKSLQLDNPHTDKIEQGLFLRAAFGIDELEKYLETNDKDSYANKFFASQKKDETIIKIIAKSWIILRFPDNNLFDTYKNNSFKLLDKIYMDENDEYIENFNILLNYSYILSLLIHNEEKYRGFSFLIIDTPTEIFYPSDKYKIYRTIENFKDYNFLLNHDNRAKYWTYWLDIKDIIIEKSKMLETVISLTTKKGKKSPLSQRESPQEKLLYIGSILKAVDHEVKNLRLKLLLLTTIIEYLVTRNPDNSKFNVEDSISKQFKLKSAILIYQNNSRLDLNKIKNSLTSIYNQRSDVAHGNFSNKKDKSDYLDSVFNLYDYIRAMIYAYIRDKNFVDYLKDN